MSELRTDVVALYVDAKGHYPELVAEWYDKKRDARSYRGDLPVVARPPCHLWTNMAAVNFKRYGGEHNRPGNDGGMFASALLRVFDNGGVLEHPAGSKAWAEYKLLEPAGRGWFHYQGPDYQNGWYCEVWQSAYGHRARKRTWLFYYSKRGNPPPHGNWDRLEGTHQIGWFDRKKPTLGKREASLTPLPFAEWLIEVAAQSARPRAQTG